MTLKKLKHEELMSKFQRHKAWLVNNDEGEKLELTDTLMENLSFSKDDFGGIALVRCKLVNVHFDQCNFLGSVFIDSIFEQSSFIGCYMRKADFRSATISGIDFSNSRLSRADMQGTIATDVNFTNCDVDGVDMIETDLRNGIFENANLNWTVFMNAKLGNTRKFHLKSFENARLIDVVDISKGGDGSHLIDSIEDLISYLNVDGQQS